MHDVSEVRTLAREIPASAGRAFRNVPSTLLTIGSENASVARNRTPLYAALGLVIVAAIALLLFRWWSGPAPEREAQHYFDQVAPGVVEVIECEYAAGPEGSVFDRYWCDLTSEGAVPRPPDAAGVAMIARGRGGYCFIIPRAAKRPWRNDMDAFPIYRARSVRDCQSG